MSDYTQTTDFSAKDDLITGDADKKIKGSEWDTELANISTAIATKIDFSPRGALVWNTANQTITTATETALTWDSESYDTDSIHSTSTNTSRLTVPSGVSKVRLQGQAYWQSTGTAGYRRAVIYKNGSSLNAYGSNYDDKTGFTTLCRNIETPVYSVSPGDYFELYVEHTEGADEDIYCVATIYGSWFAMEIIE